MSAVDEIQAAIGKLTALMSATVALPWELDNELIRADGWILAQTMHTGNEATGQLIVTLHATIDAQLAILRHTLEHYRGDLGIGTNRHIVSLARAINGDSK